MLNHRVDIRDLEAFTAVAATLHFGRAAEKLHVVPAAVTQRVRDLERELGLPLFRRTSRTVALTSGGAALLAPALAALAAVAEVAQTARSLASGTTGRVVIGLAPNAGRFAAQVIAGIGDGLPGVEVTARSLFAGPAMAALDAGEILAAVIREPRTGPQHDSMALGHSSDRFVALAAADARSATGHVSVRELEDRPVLIIERALSEVVHDRTLAYFFEHGVTPRWRHHSLQDYTQIMTLVAGGQGACLIPDHLPSIIVPGVSVVELSEPGPSYALRLVWRRDEDTGLTRLLRALRLDGDHVGAG